MSVRPIAWGYQTFPAVPCACYPECRIDCPNHERCLDLLPEYWSKLKHAQVHAAGVRERKGWNVARRPR